MYLLLGSSNALTNRLWSKLRAAGQSAMFLNPHSFPADLLVAYDAQTPCHGHVLYQSNRPPLDLQDIEGIYWWFYDGIGHPPGDGTYFETETVFLNLLENLSCRWVNHPGTIRDHIYKPAQLQLALSLGATIPDTLVSNDAQALKAFVAEHGQAMFKNVSATGVPKRVSDPALVDELLLNAPCTRPVMLQAFIAGTDVRAHVIDQAIYTTEILSQHDVSKIDIEQPLRHTLPDDVATLCLAINQAFGLVLSGIDFRKTADGQYYFLEANPSPQYPVYEDRNSYPISQRIVDYLMHGKAVSA